MRDIGRIVARAVELAGGVTPEGKPAPTPPRPEPSDHSPVCVPVLLNGQKAYLGCGLSEMRKFLAVVGEAVMKRRMGEKGATLLCAKDEPVIQFTLRVKKHA